MIYRYLPDSEHRQSLLRGVLGIAGRSLVAYALLAGYALVPWGVTHLVVSRGPGLPDWALRDAAWGLLWLLWLSGWYALGRVLERLLPWYPFRPTRRTLARSEASSRALELEPGEQLVAEYRTWPQPYGDVGLGDFLTLLATLFVLVSTLLLSVAKTMVGPTMVLRATVPLLGSVGLAILLFPRRAAAVPVGQAVLFLLGTVLLGSYVMPGVLPVWVFLGAGAPLACWLCRTVQDRRPLGMLITDRRLLGLPKQWSTALQPRTRRQRLAAGLALPALDEGRLELTDGRDELVLRLHGRGELDGVELRVERHEAPDVLALFAETGWAVDDRRRPASGVSPRRVVWGGSWVFVLVALAVVCGRFEGTVLTSCQVAMPMWQQALCGDPEPYLRERERFWRYRRHDPVATAFLASAAARLNRPDEAAMAARRVVELVGHEGKAGRAAEQTLQELAARAQAEYGHPEEAPRAP